MNLWGANTYPIHQEDGRGGWDWVGPRVADYDFDLGPWLRSGKLLWLAPGDESATPREGPSGCPFVDLPGLRRITVIRNGLVQHLSSFAGHGAG